MATTTIYDIKVRYNLDSRSQGSLQQAQKSIRGIDAGMKQANRSTGLLSRGFRTLSVAAAGFFGARMAKSALIDFNAGMEQAKIQMAGLLQLNTGGSFNDNLAKSNSLVANLQERAKASVGTTQDFVKMASMLTRPISAAGLSMKELEDITSGAVIASQAFGIGSEQAALDLEQALAGTLGKKDRFARALLEPLGVTTQEFNKLSARARAQMLKDAFDSQAIKEMAKAQEQSFAGVVSTLKDSVQRFFGAVGQPLFKAITEEIKEWNKWLEKNQDRVSEWAQQFGQTLKEAFNIAKKVIGFIVEHKDLLLSMAKAFLAFKATQGIANTLGGIGGAIMNLGKNAGRAAGALGLIAAGAVLLANKMDRAQGKQISRDVLRKSFIEQGERVGGPRAVGSSLALLSELKQRGFIEKKTGKVQEQKVRDFFNQGAFGPDLWQRQEQANKFLEQIARAQQLEESTRERRMKAQAILQAQALATSMENTLMTALIQGTAQDITNTLAAAADKVSGKPDMKVTIRKIEVQSDDPDRFVFQLAETVSNTVKKKGSAQGSLRQ